MWITIIFAVLIGLVTWWYVQLFKNNKYIGKYPGPWSVPIFGDAFKFGSVTDFIPAIMKLQNEHGPIFKVCLGYRWRLLIMDPKLNECVLGSAHLLEKSEDYHLFHSWLGTGLLTSSGAKWKRQRRLITPTFHFQILEQFIDIFHAQSNTLVKKLKNEVGKTFDIFPYVTMCALDIICEAAMGTSVHAQENPQSDYVRSVKEMCRILMERTFSPVKMWDFLYVLTADYQLEKKSLNILHSYTNSVIRKRKEELESKTVEVDDSQDTGIKKRRAFLDLLLQCTVEGEPLPDQIIREEVDTFMFEGHDTTTSGISFTLWCLSLHPDIQEKTVDELRSIFGHDQTRPPTYKDLQEMKYLDMVIKETMRLFPPVPLIARTLEQDIEYDGQILPKGLTLSFFPFGLHRRADLYADPEKFDPERFSAENSVDRSPYAYIPFSAGPRNCIGQKFAQLEMKSTVSKVLRHFELLPVHGHTPVLAAEAILKSANGLLVGLKEREF